MEARVMIRFLLILMLCLPAFGQVAITVVTNTAGLTNLAPSSFRPGVAVMPVDGSSVSFWRYTPSSAASVDGTNTLATSTGVGRWIRVPFNGVIGNSTIQSSVLLDYNMTNASVTSPASKAYVELLSPRSSSTRLYAYGDSIMDGSAVSGSTPSLRFADRVASYHGWAVSNLAYGGARIADIVWQTFPGFTRTNTGWTPTTIASTPSTVSESDVFMTAVGYNDMRDYTPSTAYMTHMRRSLSAWIAWTALPHSSKKYAQDADIQTGTWSSSTFFGGDMGLRSSTLSDSLTFSNVLGSSVYVCFMAHPSTNDQRTFSVAIDGTGYGSFQVGPAYGNRFYESGNAFQPTYLGPYSDGQIDQVPWVIRFDGLSRTAHRVVLAVTDSTDGPVEILWVAGNGATYNTKSGPYSLVGNTLRSTSAGYGVGSDSAAGGFSRQIEDVVSWFQADGLKVLYVDINSAFDPLTKMSGDNVHPTAEGHADIANAYISALSPDVSQVAGTRQERRPFSFDGDAMTWRLPSTTGQASRSLVYRGGSLPFVDWDFLAPIVDGTFIELSGTPASSTGLQRFLDLPVTIAQSGSGGYVGLGLRVTESSTGSGSKYPLLASVTRGASTINFRTDTDGNLLMEGWDGSGGRQATFRGSGSSSTQILLKYADTAADRRLVLAGNSITVVDSASAAQSLAVANNGASLVVGNGTAGTGLKVGSGSNAAISAYLSSSGTWDPANVVTGALVTTTIGCTGADVGDPCTAGLTTLTTQNAIITAHVQSANTVKVSILNLTGSDLNLDSGTLRVGVFKH